MIKFPVLVSASAAALALSALFNPALAAVYQALCPGGGECTVTIANGQLSMPGTMIQKDQVLSWAQGGSGSKTDVGMGIGAVVLFGLPGLIGFGAKKHDYQYFINYVDASGNTQATTVSFKNNVPANQFMMELMGMTGLSMGELNQPLQARIETIKAESAEKARIASLDCARTLRAYNCSWNSYLAANPSLQRWAKTYPQMVPGEKTRLRAVD